MKQVRNLIMVILFFYEALAGYAENNENIAKWAENKIIMRRVLVEMNNINELDKFDEKLLSDIEKKDITGFDKDIAELLRIVIIDKIYPSNINTAKAFLLLQDKLIEKKYFFDIVYNVANYKMISNHYILSAILQGFRKYISTDPEKLFLSLNIMNGYIDMYIISPNKEGTKIVIADLIAFLRTYVSSVQGGQLDSKYDKYILDIYNKIGFSGRSSSFDNYIGASDLKKEYSSYSDSKGNKALRQE